ncbi:MAG: SAP domain-containing protein, partial [Mobilicoccus sp.]|nr:SAP domain-containing protein [Mobilicoccus sp.]
ADATKEQTARATEATKEATQRNYNLMNTAQIKAELSSRGLETSGSLDELRARLREADGQA